MSFAVVAELPLGVYRARVGGDALDLLPTPARLHAALLCAAAAGTRAVATNGSLAPCDDDVAALEWIEANPPDGVVVPSARRVPLPQTAFRQEGVIRKEGSAPRPAPKVRGKSLGGFVAVSGTFGWTWDEPPPASVQEALGELVRDVSHLGSSESPARLRLGDAQPTHRRARDASLLHAGPGDLDLDVAQPGRSALLGAAYTANTTSPSLAGDRWSTSEQPTSPLPCHDGKSLARYARPEQAAAQVPWSVVHVIALSRRGRPIESVPAHRRVRVAVSAHKALVRLVGFGAPSLLTGAYLDGVRRPANRLALHVLDGPPARASGHGSGAVLLALLPPDADPTDVDVVVGALTSLRTLAAVGLDTTYVHAVPGDTFWPAVDGEPEWSTDPPMVADTRPPTQSWSLEQTVQLSVGMLLRDQFTPSGTGRRRYQGWAADVARAGCEVLEATKLTTGSLTAYVHTTARGALVQPFHAKLRTPLLPPRAIAALGQSRHLGGGLLVPLSLSPSP